MPGTENPRLTVICGHYGSGKTNLAVNLAVEAAAAGKEVTVVDLDLVNPYFCSKEHQDLFRTKGIALSAPAFTGTNLDTPTIPTALHWAVTGGDKAHGNQKIFIDLGGDDAGAMALGGFANEIAGAGYEMLYVINCYRVLSQRPEEAVALLHEIEAACRLRATALVNNSHLGVETTPETVRASLPFAEAVRSLTGLPLLYSTAPEFAALPGSPGIKTIRRYVKLPWESTEAM